MASRPVTVCCLAILAIFGAESRAQTQRFTLESMRQMVKLGNFHVSPDGKAVAIVVTRANYAENRNESELFSVDVATGGTRPLTRDRGEVGLPRWSPDGKTLAFLTPDSAKRMQVWGMPMVGGDARRLTDSPTGVKHYAWRPDGGAIAYVAEDEAPTLEGEARHVGAFSVGDQDIFLRAKLRPLHIWLKPLEGGEAKRLTSGPWSLEFTLPPGSPPSLLSWSADGSRIAFARVPLPESGKLDLVRVEMVDVATGEIRPLNDAERFQNMPAFSPDGRLVAYRYPREGRGDLLWESEFFVAPAEGGPGRSLTRDLDRNVHNAEWLPDGSGLLVAANDRTTVGMWVQPLDGPARRLGLGDLVVGGAFGYQFTGSRSGAVFFVAATPTRPPELYVLESADSEPRRLTDFNRWAEQVAWGPMERVTWKGPDGFDEDGVLVFPPEFSSSNKHPLVLLIHGGPRAASKMSFSELAQLMAAEGWLVFMPNYRGSDNLGNAYQTAIVGDWGRGPGRDVMAGVSEIRKRTYVDRRRTAVTGWSYGGYMTTWLAGNYPNEWTVAVAGAPVTSFEDQYNLSDGNVARRYYFGGSPWTDGRAALYREQSPISYATRIKVPTLVMSNMEDFRVPPTQAFALYRALKDNGVATEFIGFPGRTHASEDPVNVRERQRIWVEWVKRHIGDPVPPAPSSGR